MPTAGLGRKPTGPAALMTWLADLPSDRRACLECGTGGAETAAFMARHFGLSIALDLRLGHVQSVEKPVCALCGDAADLPVADHSLDLVFSVQALHHFAVERHLREARRALRPGGVFAAFCWGRISLPGCIAPAYDPVFEALEPYWEEARAWVVEGYADLAFDGEAVAHPGARMTQLLSLDALDCLIARWSATRNALASNAGIPDPEITSRRRRRLSSVPVSWPLLGQVFRV